MDVEAVLDRFSEAGVSVWLDAAGKLRIDKDAPAELKQLARQHKQELIDVRRAEAVTATIPPAAIWTNPPPIQATSWAEWKAEALNRLFQEQGRTGQRGRITAATVRHGEGGRQIFPACFVGHIKRERSAVTTD